MANIHERDQFGVYPYEWDIIAETRIEMAHKFKQKQNTEAWENFKELKAYCWDPYICSTLRVGIRFGCVFRIQSNNWVHI